MITFSSEGTGGFNSGTNFGNNYCTARNSGTLNVLVDGEPVAMLLRERETDTDMFGKRITTTTWSYMGPVKGRDGDVDLPIGNLRAAKAFAIEQLSS